MVRKFRLPFDLERALNHLRFFRSFAGWLVLALEFLLAADILKTAISPTWTDIGQLAAIAAIRTFLNYSLAHDLRHTPDANS